MDPKKRSALIQGIVFVLAILLLGLLKAYLSEPAPTEAPAPHPDFPTPERAGSQAVFLLEEPPRSPRLASVALPDRQGLTPGLHAHCELEGAELACSPELAAHPVDHAHWRVERRAGRALVAERRRPDGRVEETLVFARLPTGEPVQVASLDAHGVLVWVAELSDQGRLLRQRRRNGGNMLPGCGGLRFALDERGLPREQTCLEWGGRPMLDRDGVATRRAVRDAQGLVVETTLLDLEGRPVADHAGVHRLLTSRNPQGRPLELARLGMDGGPVVSAADGCAGLRWAYETQGLEHSRTCLGPDREPAPDARGVIQEVLSRDARGCVLARAYQDGQGRPARDARGVAGRRLAVDEACLELEETCLSAAGSATACGPGRPASYRLQRDARGQIISLRAYGPDGLPGQDAEYGVFEVRLAWDPYGNRTREACYDALGGAVECGGTGFHELARGTDDSGRVIRETFLDARGQRTTNLGTWERRIIYDNYDHPVETRNLDQRGRPASSLGQAVRRLLYDRGHRLYAVLLLEVGGRPASYTGCFTGVDCPAASWHALRVVRDGKGRAAKNQFFDTARQLVGELDCARSRCHE